jgi:hypothetical protein
MTRKLYRSAQGKTVDLGALQLRNESIRAVGNMGVNARGDLIDSTNAPISTRNTQVSKQYNRQVSNVNDSPVISSARSQNAMVVDIPEPPEDFDDNFEKIVEETAPAETVNNSTSRERKNDRSATSSKIPQGGLASAIAKARQVKQDPLTLPTLNNKLNGPSRI